METQLGTNGVTLYVVLPILAMIAAALVWFIVRIHVKVWQRLLVAIGACFAFLGFATVLFSFYYAVSPSFADTFRFYAYSALAPDARDPFNENYTDMSIMMMRGVASSDGHVTLLEHPNPAYPTLVYLFPRGQYIEANLKDGILTVPERDSKSLPALTHTSFWWAITKDVHKLISSVE